MFLIRSFWIFVLLHNELSMATLDFLESSDNNVPKNALILLVVCVISSVITWRTLLELFVFLELMTYWHCSLLVLVEIAIWTNMESCISNMTSKCTQT